MRILSIRLVNFVGVFAAMGLRDVSFDFSNVTKQIIQLYGKNRCGKTVLLQQLHPFSSINLNGDERSDLQLIIQGEDGLKEIVYDIDGTVYKITHTYRATSKNHTVSSSIMVDDEELNVSGGVNTFNQIIEEKFGINKWRFQLVICGTQLTSIANMTDTQRKTLLNRAMGIDIYDKIHKLATEDYRYTSRLVTSLSNTQEYLLSTYGSFETLCSCLNTKKDELTTLTNRQSDLKSQMDSLVGTITTLQSQDPTRELVEIQRMLDKWTSAASTFGTAIDASLYDKLVDEQMKINNELASAKSEYGIVIHDLDNCYAKKNDAERAYASQQTAINDLRNMETMAQHLTDSINSITVIEHIETPSGYLRNMHVLAQTLNSMCHEIITCLSDKQLALFVDMVVKDMDIAAFLIKEGAVLMDSEREKSVVSRLQSMINNIQGDEIECGEKSCLYRNTYTTLRDYFKAYHSTTESAYTQYDMEQFDHANKNLIAMRRMLVVEIPPELESMFNVKNIMQNLLGGRIGIDVQRIQFMMEESAKNEQRLSLIKQLNDVQVSIDRIKQIIPTDTSDASSNIQTEIDTLSTKRDSLKSTIDALQARLDEIDRNRLLLSDVKNINVTELESRKVKLSRVLDNLRTSQASYEQLKREYDELGAHVRTCQQEYDILEKAHGQYVKNVEEIEMHNKNDRMYKVIAEATSSTKGKPVIAIRDTVNHALNLTNILLNIMYENEIQLLSPVINETEFTLPFRCGVNKSADIRYGSQSESTLLSLAFSLSLVSMMCPYTVFLLDEVDGYLDANAKDGFVLMLQEIMIKLNVEQLFIISHSVGADQYPHVVQTIDISKRILDIKGDETNGSMASDA